MAVVVLDVFWHASEKRIHNRPCEMMMSGCNKVVKTIAEMKNYFRYFC